MSVNISLFLSLANYLSERALISSSAEQERQVYLLSIKRFVTFINIKSHSAALLSQLIPIDGVNVPADQPETWQYYKHLAGEYTNNDEVMTLTSTDDLSRVTLDTSFSKNHPSTYLELMKGEDFYNRLVARYPAQETLIKGILNPIDKTTAINAKDGEILYYISELIEENEYTLIYDLQEYIYRFNLRWNNTSFILSDTLYAASFLGILYMNLIPTIINLREDRCHTIEVHSFHVTLELASQGLLDRYIKELNLSQRLFLYRNIDYIKKYAGHSKTFQMMVDSLIVGSGLPLDGHSLIIKQEEETLEPVFTRDSFNPNIQSLGKPIKNITEYKEAEGILGGEESIKSYRRKIRRASGIRVDTKLLESNTIDYSESERYPRLDVLFNHWGALSLDDKYRSFVTIEIPGNDTEVVLSTKDSFILSLILSLRLLGFERDTVPLSISIPYVQSVDVITEDDYDTDVIPPEVIEDINILLQPIEDITSAIVFGAKHDLVFRSHSIISEFASSREDSLLRLHLNRLITFIFQDRLIPIPEAGIPLNDWFASRRINGDVLLSLDDDDLNIILGKLTEKSTALIIEDLLALGNRQVAVTSIIRQLSSYSIQITDEINNEPLLVTSLVYQRVLDQAETFEIGLMDGENIRTNTMDNTNYIHNAHHETKSNDDRAIMMEEEYILSDQLAMKDISTEERVTLLELNSITPLGDDKVFNGMLDLSDLNNASPEVLSNIPSINFTGT